MKTPKNLNSFTFEDTDFLEVVLDELKRKESRNLRAIVSIYEKIKDEEKIKNENKILRSVGKVKIGRNQKNFSVSDQHFLKTIFADKCRGEAYLHRYLTTYLPSNNTY